MTIEERLAHIKNEGCACGRNHDQELPELIAGNRVFPAFLTWLSEKNSGKIFLVADRHTYEAAGRELYQQLVFNRFKLEILIFEASPEPDERATHKVLADCPKDAELLLVVGSGTLNDIGKMAAKELKLPYVIYATAPSMDGYTSGTSSMLWHGRKVSLEAVAPDLVVADYDILRQAPIRSFQSGIGDMVAKAVSIPEWKVASLITGEHYCEDIANLVTSSLEDALASVDTLMERDEIAVRRLFDGLILSGFAMNLAGHSRPASGTEHYVSHIWDMRAASLHKSHDTHGRQCGVGTLLTLDLFASVNDLKPPFAKTYDQIDHFNLDEHHEMLRELLGHAAEPMIVLEESEEKYEKNKVAERAKKIESNWQMIVSCYQEALKLKPSVQKALAIVDAPQSVDALSVEDPEPKAVLKATKDIRDKYIVTRLLFDIGELETTLDNLFPIEGPLW